MTMRAQQTLYLCACAVQRTFFSCSGRCVYMYLFLFFVWTFLICHAAPPEISICLYLGVCFIPLGRGGAADESRGGGRVSIKEEAPSLVSSSSSESSLDSPGSPTPRKSRKGRRSKPAPPPKQPKNPSNQHQADCLREAPGHLGPDLPREEESKASEEGSDEGRGCAQAADGMTHRCR